MLTNKDINSRFEELIRKGGNILKVKSVVKESCSDLSINIADGDAEQVKRLEALIEQTGQFRVLKKDYIDSWNSLCTLLKTSGYSEDVIECMTTSTKFENWIEQTRA